MKLEQQVVSLELAKKMKKLGFKQESLFYWGKTNGYHTLLIFKRGDVDAVRTDMNWDYGDERVMADFTETYSAYTVAELGEMIKSGYISYINTGNNFVARVDMSGFTNRRWSEEDTAVELFKAKTEADTRAKMLIYLKENNLL